MGKEVIVSDESLNSHGFRVLTSGIRTERFDKNPVLFFNHQTDSVFDSRVYNGPLGKWEGLRVENGVLIASPVFDEMDPQGALLSHKFENDFIRAASIGFRVISCSTDESLMVPGQQLPTVTECELIEISIVDLPSNKNAVALFDNDGKKVELKGTELQTALNFFDIKRKNEIKNTDSMKVSLKAAWTSLLALLALTPGAGAQVVETELSEAQLGDINAKLEKLKGAEATVVTMQAELDALKLSVEGVNGKVVSLTAELATANANVGTLTAERDGLVEKLANYPAVVIPGAPKADGGGELGMPDSAFLTEDSKRLYKLKKFDMTAAAKAMHAAAASGV